MASLSENALYKKFTELGHSHFCGDRMCRTTYECLDVRFGFCNPRLNGRCPECCGRWRTEWTDAHAPRPCCRNNVAQVVNRDVLLAQRLAGPGPWFKCKACGRSHGWPQGHNPTEGEDNG